MLDSDPLLFKKYYANNCYLNLNKKANYSGRYMSDSLLLHSDYSKFVSIHGHNNLREMASGLQSRNRFCSGVEDEILALKESRVRVEPKSRPASESSGLCFDYASLVYFR